MGSEFSDGLKISLSAPTVLGAEHYQPLFWTIDQCAEFAKEAGYNGLQLHAFRNWIWKAQARTNNLSPLTKYMVTSVQQSYREEKDLVRAWNHLNRGLALASWFLFPRIDESLDSLEHIEVAVGKTLPVTLYPVATGRPSGVERRFSQKAVVVGPEAMKLWGVDSAQKMAVEALKKGYDGVVINTSYMRAMPDSKKGERHDLNPWQENLPGLLPYTKEIQVRIAAESNPQQASDELDFLVRGVRQSELPDILEVVGQYKAKNPRWNPRIVLSVPLSGLARFDRDNGGKGRFLTTERVAKYHKDMRCNLQQALEVT